MQRLGRAGVHPADQPEREEVLRAFGVAGLHAERLGRLDRDRGHRDLVDAERGERVVVAAGSARSPPCRGCACSNVSTLISKVEPGARSRRFAFKRGGVHRDEDVGRVARRHDVVVGDVDLERRHTGDRSGGRTDLGREVGLGRQVVAEHRRQLREPVADELHAVARVAREPDHDLGRASPLHGPRSPLRSPLTTSFLSACASRASPRHRGGAHACSSAACACRHCTVAVSVSPGLGGRFRPRCPIGRSPSDCHDSTALRGVPRPAGAALATGGGRAPGRRPRPRSRPATRSPRRPGRSAGARRRATTISSPVSSRSTHAGGSSTETGTDIARPSTRVVTWSWASRCSDGRTRTSGGLEQVPRTTATLNDAASIETPRFTARDRADGFERGSVREAMRTLREGCDTNDCAGRVDRRSTRGREAFGDVGEPRVLRADAQEQLAGLAACRRPARRDRRVRTRPAGGAPARGSGCRRAGRGSRSRR